MIDFIQGVLFANTPTRVVVDVGGVGFSLQTPASSYDPQRRPGDEVRFHTYLHVREDALTLYGFSTLPEREAFLLLTSVSGIGPPMAQRVLSGVTVAEFVRLVAAGNTDGLTRIKGIGQKTAHRLVLELKDRIGEVTDAPSLASVATPSGVAEDAVAALVGLGVNPAQARRAVSVAHAGRPGASVEELIKGALRAI